MMRHRPAGGRDAGSGRRAPSDPRRSRRARARAALAGGVVCALAGAMGVHASPAPGAAAPAPRGERPNIVLILADDLGIAHLGAYGDSYPRAPRPAGREVPGDLPPEQAIIAATKRSTPTVDRLAREGTRFLAAYATPSCAPSRAQLMTGRDPQRMGLFTNMDVNSAGVPARERFLVQLLQQHGYATAAIGKWHMGSGPGQHPLDRGFDYYFGFDASETAKFGSEDLYRDRARAAAEGFLADQLTAEAVGFLERSARRGAPFFLYLCYSEPHTPRPRAPAAYVAAIGSGDARVDAFFAYVYAMDVGIGKVMDTLDRLALSTNTLVVFASDNGAGNDTMFAGNGPLRGAKRTLWEGGIRVPMIAWWPGRVPAGRTSRGALGFLDLMPTLLAAAGVVVPDEIQLDGASALPLLLGETEGAVHGDAPVFWASNAYPYPDLDQEDAVRRAKAAGRWRFGLVPGAWAVRKGRWKLIGSRGKPPLLYDVESDVGETSDAAGGRPDVVRDLAADYAAWIRRMPRPVAWYEDMWRALLPEGAGGEQRDGQQRDEEQEVGERAGADRAAP
jgi:uncharacterized sulfatase